MIGGYKVELGLNALCKAETILGPLPALLSDPAGAASFKTLRALVWAGLPEGSNIDLADVDALIGDMPPAEIGALIGAKITENAGQAIKPEVKAQIDKIKSGLGLEERLGDKSFKFSFAALAALENDIGPVQKVSADPANSISFTTIRAMLAHSARPPMSHIEAGDFMQCVTYAAASAFMWALMRATFPAADEKAADVTKAAPGKPKAA